MPYDRREHGWSSSRRSARGRVRLRGIVALGLVTACAASSSVDWPDEGERETREPRPSATLPGPGSTSEPPAGDAAAGDAGADANARTPEPGDPCPVVDAILTRPCGLCGSQEAVCLSDPSRPSGGTVSPYGPCHDETTNGCAPGSTEVEACGNCGTLTKTCTRYCAWHRGACKEPPGACVPTTHEITKAGCSGGGFRVRTCSSACAWTSYSATCTPLDIELSIASETGARSSAILPLSALFVDKRPKGKCPSVSLSTTTKHPQLYVELVNPTGKTARVSVWNARAPDGPEMDTVMAAYDGHPATDAERAACRHGIADTCPPGLGCEKQFAGLEGVSIPPFGSVVIWFGAYWEVGTTGAGTSEGKVMLVVRTEALE